MNEKENNKSIEQAPSLEVDIRTMEGDAKALKEFGGETIGLKGEKENISRQNETSVKDEISKFAAKGGNFIFPQEERKEQGLPKSFVAAPTNIESVKVVVGEKKNSVFKIILIISGILVLAIGFGVLGYYLSPIIFGK